MVECRYAVGEAILIGSGPRWMLITDPRDDRAVDHLWDLLAAGGDSMVEALLTRAEQAFGGPPDGFALVDFASAGGAAVSRGTGQVHVDGSTRTLSLDGPGADPAASATPDRPLRRLVGGVVNAGMARLSPIAHKIGPVMAGHIEAPDHSTTTPSSLIDGIPTSILEAVGPDGPPPRARRRADLEAGGEPVEDTFEPYDTTQPPAKTASRFAQAEPEPQPEPVPEPEFQPEPPSSPPLNEDLPTGTTRLQSPHLSSELPATVMAVRCPLGHASPPESPLCWVCRQQVAPQLPQSVLRPVLGGLRLPTDEVVPLDRGVVIGRRPAPVDGSTSWPHLVHLSSDYTFVSRKHLQIELDGWEVIARDLGSRGGTALRAPGRDAFAMLPGEAYVLEPGTELDLAEGYVVRFETSAGVL